MITDKEILDYDREHIWHPYTSMVDPLPVYLVERAEGVSIYLSDGRKLIDGMSSWWSAIHGYNNPRLNKAASDQINKMSHVMFGGLTHRPAVELADRLVSMTPDGLTKVFYCDSGSVSVEVAMKMALQYQHAIGRYSKNKIATVRSGYHGDTWHAMSVCDPDTGMHSLYTGRLSVQYFIDSPNIGFYDQWDSNCMSQTEDLFRNEADNIAAFIIEPIVQGAGGMKFYHPEYLKSLYNLCHKHDILLIADEVATGFGRSGKMFACEWAGITPDIMCLGKAITGGYMSFAATMTTDHVAESISKSSPYVFMHGPTFMGNPLACAIAVESMKILEDNSPLKRISEIESILKRELKEALKSDDVSNVRVLGAIGVIEMKNNVDMADLQRSFVDRGVWIRPFGKLVYIMPQYIISDEELTTLARAMIDVV